jgi:acetyltransferase-like isoleucine patch superfamily enzyme
MFMQLHVTMAESRNETKKRPMPITKYILLAVIVFLIFSLGFFPVVFTGKMLLYFLAFDELWHWLLLPFIIYIGFVILIVSELLFSGFMIWVLKIRYEPGECDYSLKNKNAFKWIIICSLYTPCRKIIEIFPVGGLKNVYYKLLGMKIGKNTLVGGVIKDPCVTTFGDNTTMGEYAIIYGHIHNREKGKIMIGSVIVGDNCVIGAGSIIMPGAVLQDNVVLAAGAVVVQNQVLEKGNTYAGIPAKEIKMPIKTKGDN